MEDNRINEKAFTRNRILSFVNVIVVHIHIISKSLSVEISNFINRFHTVYDDCTKQAFSKARQKLKYLAFVKLNQALVEQYYSDDLLKTYKGYVLLACDGSRLQLPNEKELIDKFGVQESQELSTPMAMSLSNVMYDVLNKIAVNAILGKADDNERQQLIEHINYMKQLFDKKQKKAILLLDRGYPSLYILAYLAYLGIDYVIRCKSSFTVETIEFANSNEDDIIINFDLKKGNRKYDERIKNIIKNNYLKVRCVKIILPNGQIEYLLTSLTDKNEITQKNMSELYNLRWGVETHYDFQKNDLQIENFSSKTVNGIKQDYYAGIFTSNLTSLIIAEAQEEINETEKETNNKYHYEINRAVALGIVRDELPNLFFKKGEDPKVVYEKLRKKIMRRKNPVIPGRSFERKKSRSKRKYKMNSRSVL